MMLRTVYAEPCRVLSNALLQDQAPVYALNKALDAVNVRSFETQAYRRVMYATQVCSLSYSHMIWKLPRYYAHEAPYLIALSRLLFALNLAWSHANMKYLM